MKGYVIARFAVLFFVTFQREYVFPRGSENLLENNNESSEYLLPRKKVLKSSIYIFPKESVLGSIY